MPITNGIGYSKNTPLKADIFYGMLRLLLPIYSSVAKRWNYIEGLFFADLTAGCGWIPTSEEEAPGCAQIWLQAMNHSGLIRCPVNFIEMRKDNCLSLSEMAEFYNREIGTTGLVHHARYEEWLPFAVQELPSKPHTGLIYIDPNGIILGLPELRQCFSSSKLHMVDVLLHVGATSFKRAIGAGCDTPSLLDTLGVFFKKHWIVREPYEQNQWTFLLGTQWINMPVWDRAGFHSIKSSRGMEILDRLTLTQRERDALANERISELPGISAAS